MDIATTRHGNITSGEYVFDPNKIKKFVPFAAALAVIGGNYGDEGKGKFVDYKSDEWKKQQTDNT